MKHIAKQTARLVSRNLLSTATVVALMGASAFALTPGAGGFNPGDTLNPSCTPGSTDCFVKNIGTETDPLRKFVDGTTMTDAVFSGGNVGIGTDTPRKLTTSSKVLTIDGGTTTTGPDIEFVGNNVVAGSNPHGRIQFINTVGGVPIMTSMIGGYGNGTGQDSGDLRFYVKPSSGSLSQSMHLSNDGNVGIGTTSQSAKLHVQGDMLASGIQHDVNKYQGVELTEISGNSLEKKVYFNVSPGSYNGVTNTGDGTYFKIGQIRTGGNYGTVHINGIFHSGRHVGYEEKVNFELSSYSGNNSTQEPIIKYIKYGGATSDRLLMYKTLNADGNGSTYIDIYILMGHVNEGYGEMDIKIHKMHGNSPSVFVWQKGENAGTTIPLGDMLTPNRNFSFDTSGNIGVGTTTPNEKLDVVGNIKASGTVCDSNGCIGSDGGKFVDGTNTADAVFTGGKVGIGINNPTGLLELQNGTYNELKFSGTDHTNIVSDGDIYIKSSKASGIIKFDGDGGGTNDLVVRLGKVGVGTIVPLAKLSVVTDGLSGDALKITDGTNTDFVIKQDGNVGIGTTTPSSKLHVTDSSNSTYHHNIMNTGRILSHTAGSETSTRFALGDGTTGTSGRDGLTFSLNGLGLNVGGAGIDSPVPGRLALYTADGTNFKERIRIDNVGNVGIGTANPTTTLEVGTSQPHVFINSAAGGQSSLSFGRVGTKEWMFRRPGSTTDLILRDELAGVDRVTFQQGTGNVGIGTTSPTSKLHINGIIEYADNAAAIAGGLTAGAIYRTGDVLKIVH